MSTFQFAIIYGFFITRSFARYNQIEELIASEDAYWLSVYRTAQLWGKGLVDKLRELIDRYYIISYDYELGYYYKQTAPILDEVYQVMTQEFKPTGDRLDDTYAEFLVFLATIEDLRNRLSVRAQQRMTLGHWALLYVLGGIIVFSLFALKTPQLHSQVITVLLSTMVVLLFLVLRDLNSLRLGSAYLATESGQEVLEAIGKLRYYSKMYSQDKTARIPKTVKKYRQGLHNAGEPLDIKVVERT